jgi:hypothetical protein
MIMYTIEVKYIDENRISILGKEYYSEDYVEEMMRREYSRGKKDGQHIHIARIERIENTKTTTDHEKL